MPNLRDFLTREKGPDDRKLFKSGRDLGEFIAQIPHEQVENTLRNNPYFGRRTSATSLINQVFRYDRPAYDDLRLMLKQALRIRLSVAGCSQSETEGWMRRLEEAVAQNEVERQARRAQEAQPRSVWSELVDCEGRAQHIFIINGTHYNGPRLATHNLRRVLMRRMRLCVPPPRPNTEYAAGVPTCTVCVDSERRAAAYLRGLFELTVQKEGRENPGGQPLAPHDAAQRLRELTQAGVMRMLLIEPMLGGIPVVAYDPESDTPSVFLPGYDEQNNPSVHKLPPYLARNWKQQTFLPLKDSRSIAAQVWLGMEEKLLEEAEADRLRNSLFSSS